MSWLSLPALARFVGWRTRLNRMQFGVGYIALCFGGAIVLQIFLLAIASIAGGIDEAFNHPEWTMPAFLLFVPLLWGLLAGRAHDIGWPVWPIVLLYLAPWPAWAVVMDGAMGLFGGAVASAVGDVAPMWLLNASMFVPVGLVTIALIVLAATPGQNRINRFGDPPAPGLWNDLPVGRA